MRVVGDSRVAGGVGDIRVAGLLKSQSSNDNKVESCDFPGLAVAPAAGVV